MMFLNDLSGKAWIRLSKSVWITQKLLAWSHRTPLDHTSTFFLKKRLPISRKAPMDDRPIDESRVKLIKLLTQQGQRVCDPNVHYGDTLKAALSAQREFIGIGETHAHCEQIRQNLETHLKDRPYRLLNLEDHPRALTELRTTPIDLLLSEMPAFDFKHYHRVYPLHVTAFKKTIDLYHALIKPKGYLALMVADQRHKERYYCRHGDVIKTVEQTRFTVQGLITMIQDSQALTAYGYPSTYVPNIINQFVVIARRD